MAVPENHLVANLAAHVGHDFGASEPVVLDQRRIDRFAQCTGDHQWMRVPGLRDGVVAGAAAVTDAALAAF